MEKPIKLSDLFLIGSSKRVLKSQWQKSGVPFYRGREVTKLSKDGFVDNELFITEELYTEYSEKYGVPTNGDIVITAIGTIGNSYIVSENDRFYFKDASVLWLKKKSKVCSEYINLWLKSSLMKEQLDEGNGATVDTLTIKKLQNLRIELPSLEEQKRIVAILNQVFADIEQARAKTEQNLKNARELFESACTKSIFSSDASPNHIVSDVAKDEKGSMRTGPFGSQLLKKEIVDEGIAVLGIDNAVNNHFQWGAKRFITQEKFEELSRFEVKPDDVLITIMGTCGRCAIVPKNIPKAINTKHICCITLEQSKCLPEYLHAYFLYHPIAKEYLLSRAKGAIMAGLNMGIIKELPLILPTLEEQKNLVSRVTKFKGHIDALEVTYRSKLNALEALKKSILQKAFAGELSKSIA
jgi:type I restriction enzyme S subunit